MSNQDIKRKHIIHVKENKLNSDGSVKLPNVDSLVYGEIGVTYKKGHENLCIKNDKNEIVTFPNTNQIQSQLDDIKDKIDIPDAGVISVNGLTGVVELDIPNSESFVTKEEFIESELTTSESLNDLNQRIVNISIPDVSNFVDKNDLSSEIDILNDKIDNIDIPEFDKTGLATEDYVNAEIDKLESLIPSQLTAGNNVNILNNQINVIGYRFGDNGNLSLNDTDKNQSDGHGALGNYSTVCGFNCKTSKGETSANSFVGGDECIASHQDCFVYGKGLNTITDNETVIGKFNNYNNFNTWGNNKPLLEVGGGSSTTKRRTLFMVQKNTGIVFASSEFKVEGMGDFAEYFEWADGNPDNEDRVGYMVQLKGDKIEFAENNKKCVGVVSNTNSFTADSASLDWQGRYLKDEWGRIIYEIDDNGEKTAKENPAYDPTLEYIPRMYRKEWSPVGLVGKMYVRQNGTLIVGGFAGCENGIATNVDDGYPVLKIINNEIALILVK